jgi:zinc transporter, ZIP family
MVIQWFIGLNPVLQALLATLFTWGVTALGAGLVFFFRDVSRNVMNSMLGFASGVMIAASVWSLLIPALELAADGPLPVWLPVAIGFLIGGLFIAVTDQVLPHIHPRLRGDRQEGLPTSWRRSILLVMAVTLHNIPEGLAVGVAFGALAVGGDATSIAGAVALAIGIGIQNFPEGAAVSIPLHREGVSKLKSFGYGQASGMVEPVAGVLGALAVASIQPVLPYALAFAAGAMIFVVAEELIPESQMAGSTHVATWGVMAGFAVMMTLDVALG